MKDSTRDTVIRSMKVRLALVERTLRNALEFLPSDGAGYEVSNQAYRNEIEGLKTALEDLEEEWGVVPVRPPEGEWGNDGPGGSAGEGGDVTRIGPAIISEKEIVKAAMRGSDGGNLVACDPPRFEGCTFDGPSPPGYASWQEWAGASVKTGAYICRAGSEKETGPCPRSLRGQCP